MIKIFRRIRKDIMEKNKSGSSAEASAKTGKYLKYAIGEIMLVVIGILIALSINNANDERKEKIELNNYLLKISNDVNRDIEQLKSLKIKRDSVRAIALQLFNLLIKKNYNDMNAIREGLIIFREFYFIPNKSGFEAIKTSPYLGKINNTKLDSLLTEYYAAVDNIENRELGYNTFIEVMEADLDKSVDILAYFTLNILEWHPGLLDIDTSEINWKNKIMVELYPIITHNSFRAALGRVVVSDKLYIESYSNLQELGINLVSEIKNTLKGN